MKSKLIDFHCIMAPKFLIFLLCSFITTAFSNTIDSERVTFTFPEFQYKETSKNELTYREFESACDQSPSCQKMTGVIRVLCVRQCISPSCYQDLYSYDLLEEGEVDVRLNSFKGCFIQRYNRPRP